MSLNHSKYYTQADIDMWETAKKDVLDNQINVTCVGLYNHGKSTLLNVLVEDFNYKTFQAADVRTTTKSKSVKVGDITYIDTPGLNAQKHDDKRVMDAIRSSDITLFVHNITTGEFSKKEIEFLDRVKKYWKNPQEFINRTIFVLSRIDTVNSEQDIVDALHKMQKQIQEIFETKATIIPVSSIRYAKGILENKKILQKKSNITQMKETLNLLCQKSKKEIQETKLRRLDKVYTELKKKLNNQIQKNKLTINQLNREKAKRDKEFNKDIQEIETRLKNLYSRLP
ncbi:MAG TPA: hypothetical protein ENK66_00680 [Arcobacter sp.]|nr:hypothetical protein [Arcobacter sp.]